MFSKAVIKLQVALIFIILAFVTFFGDGSLKPIFKTETGAICLTLMLCTLAICHSIENRK